MEYTEDITKQLNECNLCYMLGILATDETSFPTCGEEQNYITVMKGSTNIVFYIKPLSYEPDPIITISNNPFVPSLYIGIDIFQNHAVLPVEYRFLNDINEKKRIIEEKLKGNLLLFKPKITIKPVEGKELFYKNVEIITVDPDVEVSSDLEYIPIPKINYSNIDFEKKLREGNGIILRDYPNVMVEPEYIICGDYIYCNFEIEAWNRDNKNNMLWSYTGDIRNIKKIPINMDSFNSENKIFHGTDNIIFIEKQYLFDNVENKLNTGETISIILPEIEYNNEFAFREYDFLTAFKKYTINQGLCYDESDLINFHICLKTNSLTIIAGMSGTGKTQLARTYADMLGLSEKENTLLFLPISPSYTEPGDLLGYLNNNNGLYIPSETGLTEFIIHAMDNPDKMHMVIFDEMNLSQVEHWFAPFISLLELNPEHRTLSLYSEKAHCINSSIYRPTITIGSNIIFVGTVNLDETTKDFSDRLLDRANVIVLKKRSFVELKREQDYLKNEDGNIEQNMETSYYQYSSWIKNSEPLSVFTDEELEFFDQLHNLIHSTDEKKGVSFRVIEKIGKYLQNIPVDKNGNYMLSRRDAIDIQVKQRILTKLKGTENQYENLIGKMMPDNNVPQNSDLYKFFNDDKAQRISDFKLTKQEIIRKAKELSVYGYAN